MFIAVAKSPSHDLIHAAGSRKEYLHQKVHISSRRSKRRIRLEIRKQRYASNIIRGQPWHPNLILAPNEVHAWNVFTLQLPRRFADVTPCAVCKLDRHRISHPVPLLADGSAHASIFAIMLPQSRCVFLKLLDARANGAVRQRSRFQELPPEADPTRSTDRLCPFEQLGSRSEPGYNVRVTVQKCSFYVRTGDAVESRRARWLHKRDCPRTYVSRLRYARRSPLAFLSQNRLHGKDAIS